MMSQIESYFQFEHVIVWFDFDAVDESPVDDLVCD